MIQIMLATSNSQINAHYSSTPEMKKGKTSSLQKETDSSRLPERDNYAVIASIGSRVLECQIARICTKVTKKSI